MWTPKLNRIAICLAPLAVAIVGAFYVRSGELAGALVQARLELDLALLGVGLLLSLACLVLWLAAVRTKRLVRLATEEAKESARQEHHRFTGRLNHELKNPLTTMRANLVNLRATQPSTPALESIDALEGQVERLVGLTDDIRKLAAFEATELSLEPIDVSTLLHDLEQLCADSPGFHERKLVLVLPEAPWPVRRILADADLLQLALYNLLDNAAKYSDPGDTIELRAAEDVDQVRLTVADTGLGVAQHEQPLVFDELYRGRNASNREGTGIGLTLVDRIADKHGWRLEVASEETVGTRITLVAPIAR